MVQEIWLLPDELKKARERRGLSLQEVVEKSGFHEEIIREWEAGQEAPTLEEASTLAELYHCSLRRFLAPTAEASPRHDLRLQRPMVQDEHERLIKEATSQFEHWCETAANLEALVGQRTVTLRPIDTKDATALATAIRQNYQLGKGPIRNIRRLLEQNMGVLVFTLPLDGVSGMSWWHPKAGPAVLVNRNDTPIGRQHWTLAHELAHLLRNDSVVICDTVYVNYSDQRERFADSFAAEFLVPRDDVVHYIRQEDLRNVLHEDETLYQIGRRYGVSREATSRRLESVGLLRRGFTEEQLPRWLERRKRRQDFGRRVSLRRRRVIELGKPVVARAIQAHLEKKVTLSKLAEDLGLGTIEAEALVYEWQAKGGSR